MKNLTSLFLGIALGSLSTHYLKKYQGVENPKLEQSSRGDTARFDYKAFFELAELRKSAADNTTTDDLELPESFRAIADNRSDYFIVGRTLPDFDKIVPNSTADEEWKRRDYGLYVFPNSQE